MPVLGWNSFKQDPCYQLQICTFIKRNKATNKCKCNPKLSLSMGSSMASTGDQQQTASFFHVGKKASEASEIEIGSYSLRGLWTTQQQRCSLCLRWLVHRVSLGRMSRCGRFRACQTFSDNLVIGSRNCYSDRTWCYNHLGTTRVQGWYLTTENVGWEMLSRDFFKTQLAERGALFVGTAPSSLRDAKSRRQFWLRGTWH